ncbi:MAG: DNA internalization-related competence protein ComEC/Rec2 [Thioalkalivibrio sp.]|nr:MAG: DNA internalization-related competence protein ComEC/Rec2 [Thioalkalivibrio sp.]
MIPFAAALTGGSLALHLLPAIPDGPWIAFAVLALLALPLRILRIPAGFLLGLSLAGAQAQAWLERAVPPEMTGTEITVIGVVAQLPDHSPRRTRVVLHLTEIIDAPPGFHAERLRMTVFPAAPRLEAGDPVRVRLRLRAPRGLHNPGGFDFAAWLYRERIHGLASLRGELEWLERGGHRSVPGASLHRLRANIRDAMRAAHPGARHPGVMEALVIGERGGMQAEEWRLFLHSGTNHLMAISGLHVGLVAGFALLLARLSWRHQRLLRQRVSLRWFGALAAIGAAATYAALAGFSIPTQRALVMLILFSTAVLARRDPLSWQVYAAAVVAVVALWPASVLAPGFWFSFGAVAVILLLVQGRVARPGAAGWLRIQVVLAVALLPLSLAWFQLGSWVAPVANLVAVPVVSFLVLPFLLAGAALAVIWTPLGTPLLWWADAWLALLLRVLAVLVEWPAAVSETAIPWAAAVLAGVGVLLILLPRSRRLAPWVLLACLPLLLPPAPRLTHGDFRAEMLDVGQGLAVVVQTRQHVLVYDAGPAWEDGFDSGAAVVLPALRRLGVRAVDRVVVSHEHMDHRGGVAAVLSGLPVTEVLSRRGALRGDEGTCEAGLSWEWDGVVFETLHPPPYWDDGNIASCVLAVRGPHGRLLLTGDLEGLGESVLVHAAGGRLHTDVLLVPHHGASGVLARGLLDAASPGIAWVSSGFDNRFSHPASDVRARLDDRCVPLFDTRERGMVWLETTPEGIRLGPGSRVEQPRFWHPPVVREPSLPAACPPFDGNRPLPIPGRAAGVE